MDGSRQVDKVSAFPAYEDGSTGTKIYKTVHEGNHTTPWCVGKYSFRSGPEVHLEVLGEFARMHGDSTEIEYDLSPVD